MRITVQQLRTLVESAVSEASRSKGEWSGLGTDTPIWHRHEPVRRGPRLKDPLAPSIPYEKYVARARELWDAASPEQRDRFLAGAGWSRIVSIDEYASSAFSELEALVQSDKRLHRFAYRQLLFDITNKHANGALKGE